ncbi:hypothetical protein ACOB87_10355 [Streptomyces sp. YS-B37]|uniref:hypothetical protein n=1 Tax=Streptomyces sp. YS-B37 TaxID=3407669 RepID=UPI003B506884
MGNGCAVVGYWAADCAVVGGVVGEGEAAEGSADESGAADGSADDSGAADGAVGDCGAAGGMSGVAEDAVRVTLRWIVGGACPGAGIEPVSVRCPVRPGGTEAPAMGLASAGIAVTGAPRDERRRAGGVAAGVGEPGVCEGASGAGVDEPAAEAGSESPCGERVLGVPLRSEDTGVEACRASPGRVASGAPRGTRGGRRAGLRWTWGAGGVVGAGVGPFPESAVRVRRSGSAGCGLAVLPSREVPGAVGRAGKGVPVDGDSGDGCAEFG